MYVKCCVTRKGIQILDKEKEGIVLGSNSVGVFRDLSLDSFLVNSNQFNYRVTVGQITGFMAV